ncbi:protein rotatin homolog, partial [Culicoides brevitarsis]|uniref:protein rotatin homolog n=1 Tax=Culicoides brevitarsis TaxID=469753 RepID=UPI00307BC476
MSLLITNSTISKLTHGLPDIRQRALKEVASKVKEGSRNKDEFVCSSVDLYKELVKAINDTKLSQSEYVEVLLDLFKSHYGTSLVKIIGIPQIKRDTQNAFRKIYSGNLKLRTPIDEFSRFLKKFEVEDVLPQIFSEKVSLNPQPNFKLDFPDEDYVNRWSKPPQKDYHEMESLKMSLVDYQNVLGMEHALTFLHKSVKNLPAEYFLQPPYLYKNLLDCLQIENYEKSSLTVLLDLTKALQARMKVRTLTRTCEIFVDDAIDEAEMRSQLSVKAFCRHLMAAAMRALKEIDDHECQERLNVFFELMSAVVNVMKSCKAECSAVLCDMTEFLQYYRAQYQSEKGNFRCRVNYFAMLQMIATLASTKMNEDYGDELQVWQKELETSLMDFSFREMMPDVYEHIYELCNGEKNVRLTNMVHAAEILSPAVDLLRSPNKFNDEELILNGLSMLETLKIHKSEGLVRKLMTAILNCTPNFQNDPNLRKHGEHLFLRLLATSVPRLKSIAYQLATDAVKNFFAQVVDGVMLKRYEVHDERGARFMGIPLNTEILGEIISFGLKNNNEVIRRGAEIIITYIVKGKTVLGKHWMKFLQVLMPLLPLLQSIEPVSSLLGHGITSLFDPDFDLPPLECMHGNMRYLFSNESQAREDACLRLIYMTSSQLNSANYLPKIDHVKSTLTNTFCILRNRMPLRNPLKMGVFDVQSMRELVEVLKSQEASPKVRYSTLIQLNAFMDDPTLCDVLHQQKGWPYVLQ